MQRTAKLGRTLSAIVLLLSLIGGCAAKELASTEQDQAAKSFLAPANKSNIYVVRRSGIRGQAIHMSISLDREVVGAIQNKTYLLLEVDPGQHRLEIGNSVKNQLPNVDFLHPVRIELETLPGRNYFVVGNMTMGRPNIGLVSESEGKGELRKRGYRRVAALR